MNAHEGEMTMTRKPMRKYSVLIVDSGAGGCDEIEEMVIRTGDYRAERV
ncbi:MAG: hypothetical protein RIT14_1238, partial [Pseudomonadota bacterium]